MNGNHNQHGNYKRVIDTAETSWDYSQRSRLSGLNVTVLAPNHLADQFGRRLHHFCTSSYLGLDYHPRLLNGAVDAIRQNGTLRIANSRNRCKLGVLDDYEWRLSELFQSHCLATLSCSAASAGVLPLLAAGVFSDKQPPTLVFDRFANASMSHVKAACADETQVLTLPHNDMDQLEQVCRDHPRVAYVADGLYSMGGMCDLEGLLFLQERYGLLLYLDDSHALSTLGEQGAGLVRPEIDQANEQTIIVASLDKSFGAGGGLVMLGSERHKRLIHRYGGPTNWSQSLNTAVIGAGLASIELHRTHTLTAAQDKLQKNLRLFDSLVPSEQAGSRSPIRLVRTGDAQSANQLSARLADQGYLTSAVFFPIVPNGSAAVRITLRADMEASVIIHFCTALLELAGAHLHRRVSQR
ncbi:aminotransferase class I/II-fold pyridoxal phosphate-dependent enzyme [Pseudomonas cremoricolorata]|uniref:aminotransferase class I/II-fold pyridoxal phosphate-dependent enzyme n=1 Tax=Pseudomonas cremoricolorata TaxID=157783 RepID=UPI00040CAD0F|nr:aminotransferase class I/II-fold pyridoxal phosphate-dependent enzyme [Pseudomonas cremoricolorata]